MMVLVALLALQTAWGVLSDRSTGFCMDQPAGMEALVGEPVTLPCKYTYPREIEPVGEARIVWKIGDGDHCGTVIYDHAMNHTHDNYTHRISLVGDPVGSRTLSIRIGDLKVSDSTRYCCRVLLLIPNSTEVKTRWESPTGTLLRVRDNVGLRGYQPESIPAMAGDSIIINCEYTYHGGLSSTHNVIIEWAVGVGPSCGDQFIQPPKTSVSSNDQDHMFLVTDSRENQTGSIRINQLKLSDRNQYCCRVKITAQEGGLKEWSRPYGTKLIVGGRTNSLGYNVTQPEETSAQVGHSATLTCTFTHPPGKDPYWIGVFWRIKQDLEEFIYHPDPKLVHASYRGRTQLIGGQELTGTSTVLLHNVTGRDNNTYYCLVEFRFCNAPSNTFNNIVSVIKEGNGTTLSVKGAKQAELAKQTVVLAAGVVVAVVVVMVLTGVVVFIFWKKGRKRQDADLIQSPPSLAAEDRSNNGVHELSEPRMHEEEPRQKDAENVVYASLDMDKPAMKTRKPHEEEETLYAAVRVN